jgi:hypothetical protein
LPATAFGGGSWNEVLPLPHRQSRDARNGRSGEWFMLGSAPAPNSHARRLRLLAGMQQRADRTVKFAGCGGQFTWTGF